MVAGFNAFFVIWLSGSLLPYVFGDMRKPDVDLCGQKTDHKSRFALAIREHGAAVTLSVGEGARQPDVPGRRTGLPQFGWRSASARTPRCQQRR